MGFRALPPKENGFSSRKVQFFFPPDTFILFSSIYFVKYIYHHFSLMQTSLQCHEEVQGNYK